MRVTAYFHDNKPGGRRLTKWVDIAYVPVKGDRVVIDDTLYVVKYRNFHEPTPEDGVRVFVYVEKV